MSINKDHTPGGASGETSQSGNIERQPIRPKLASKNLPIQPAPIHPDLLTNQLPFSAPRAERRDVPTKWTIPERPKPGRKPKEPKQPPKVTNPKPTNNATTHSNPTHVAIPVNVGSSLQAITEVSSAATSVQTKYIELLEQRVETLQKEKKEEVDHYKTLASDLESKASRYQEENNVMKGHLEVLRTEVTRLRKKLSLSTPKPATNVPTTAGLPINITKRRNEPVTDCEGSPSSAEISTSKKPRQHTTLSPLNQLDQQQMMHIPVVNNTHRTRSNSSRVNNLKHGLDPSLMKTPLNVMDDGCGLCTSEADCVCRQVGLRPLHKIVDISENDLSKSISVPIRSRPRSTVKPPKLWDFTDQFVESQPTISGSMKNTIANQDSKGDCSGNPSDCPACCDDAFGKAFCTAISNSTTAQQADTTPSDQIGLKVARSDPIVDIYTNIPCCGEPTKCGSQSCFETIALDDQEQMVSCSDAWRKLKVHPNIGNANLQLLADVVARQCASSDPTRSNHGISNNTPIERSAVEERAIASQWSQGPHATLATVFENVQESQGGSRTGSPNSTESPQSDPGSTTAGNRLIRFVAKRSLQDALNMLDGANS
ncbi:uncharacterized protein MELLADRAFT_102213 [Melampsora larici-populina 98AG31]|uniref:Hap4 transcription factor heteromerisation domain-containing protein n=1 Tax=Melampsora larici-populina (strain 98AG31 / pathotype 3-4-7) TaxID=747676 RepID=F4R7J9_MELLP|nr:uncharacterized protein MELLADRAFT_102213 [Melampsora larici-populina 98AG31]EGG11772.1 hypothetical protein MELLADRAFT_102213 [Melampsora larici-populina 98AG31]